MNETVLMVFLVVIGAGLAFPIAYAMGHAHAMSEALRKYRWNVSPFHNPRISSNRENRDGK